MLCSKLENFGGSADASFGMNFMILYWPKMTLLRMFQKVLTWNNGLCLLIIDSSLPQW